MTTRGEHEGDVLDEVGLVGEVLDDAEQRVAAGDVEQELLQGDEPGADDQPDDQHQRRMAAVAGTERVAHAHDVPLAGGVAPRQPVVLGDDRQLVGGPLGEAERGGVGERPAGAVGGAADAPSNPRGSIHARTHSQCSARTSPCCGRPLGPRADPLQQPHGRRARMAMADGARRRARDGERVDDGVRLAAAHRPPPQRTRRARSVTTGGPRASTSQRRLVRPLAAGVGDDGPGEPPPPPARQAQAGDLDAGAGDAGQRAGGELVDVVEDLLLVAREGVALAAAPVGEQDDLVLGVLDAQPAAGDEVEQRGDGRRRA